MKKLILVTMAVFVSSSAFAGLNDLIGHYNLVNSQVEGKAFCYRNIDIVQEENGLLSLYRSDTSEYGPIVSAAVNGAKRENSYSHGEALSTTKGNDSDFRWPRSRPRQTRQSSLRIQ